MKSTASNQQCIYCGNYADSRDHVPPKCLLETPFPPNLITVPACKACNQGSSRDEEYLLTVLAQIGTSPALIRKIELGGTVDRALTRSPRFAESIERSLIPENERVILQVDTERINRTVLKIAKGLLYLRYGAMLRSEDVSHVFVAPYNIDDLRRMASFVATFTERFLPKRWTDIQPGIFSHIVVRGAPPSYICVLDMHQTLWAEIHLLRLPRRACRKRSLIPRRERENTEQLKLILGEGDLIQRA